MTTWTSDELDRIDAAYRTKYGRCSEHTIGRITSREARSTRYRLVPHAADCHFDEHTHDIGGSS